MLQLVSATCFCADAGQVTQGMMEEALAHSALVAKLASSHAATKARVRELIQVLEANGPAAADAGQSLLQWQLLEERVSRMHEQLRSKERAMAHERAGWQREREAIDAEHLRARSRLQARILSLEDELRLLRSGEAFGLR